MARPAESSNGNGAVGGYLLERVNVLAGSLSASELRVARLIVERPYELIEWSAQELAEQSGTSGATVVRTCRQLGFSGLRDLRLTLARDLGWPTVADHSARHGGRQRSALQELFDDAAHSLGGMVTKECNAAFKRAVDCLFEAPRILVVSAGPTQVFAYDFAVNARLIGKQAEFWPDVVMQNVNASQLTRKDVCLAASASGVNGLTIDAATTAREAGAKVIAVTGFQQSRLAEIASITLVANTFDFSTKSQAAINSAGMLLMLRALVIGITNKQKEHGEKDVHAVMDSKQIMRRYGYRRPNGQSPTTNGANGS